MYSLKSQSSVHFTYYRLLLSIVPFPPFPPSHTHHIPSFYPPIVCPSNVSQNEHGYTALAAAISKDKHSGTEGCAECAAMLRAAGAEE